MFCFPFYSFRQKLEEISNSTDAVAIEVISQKNLQCEQEINALREQIINLKSTNGTHLGQQDKFLNDVVSKRRTDVSCIYFYSTAHLYIILI